MDPNLARLRRFIVENHSGGEFQVLCFDLGVRYDRLPGETFDAKVPEFLMQLGRRKPPVFAFLDRKHPVNRIAGLVRHKLTAIRIGGEA